MHDRSHSSQSIERHSARRHVITFRFRRDFAYATISIFAIAIMKNFEPHFPFLHLQGFTSRRDKRAHFRFLISRQAAAAMILFQERAHSRSWSPMIRRVLSATLGLPRGELATAAAICRLDIRRRAFSRASTRSGRRILAPSSRRHFQTPRPAFIAELLFATTFSRTYIYKVMPHILQRFIYRHDFTR